MDKEYVMHIAQTIKEQLLSFTPIPRLYVVGSQEFVATVFQELPALRLKVNGRLHAGYVVIALNGSDYYEVYLLKEDDSNAKCVNEEGLLRRTGRCYRPGYRKRVRTRGGIR